MLELHAVGDDGSRRCCRCGAGCGGRSGEEQLLARVEGPALDVGCGAGRHVVALRPARPEALGVEISGLATAALARVRGARVVEGSIFDASEPRSSRWATALLLDGNIGIGGDPSALLPRVGQLLRPAARRSPSWNPLAPLEAWRRVRLEAPRQRSAWIRGASSRRRDRGGRGGGGDAGQGVLVDARDAGSPACGAGVGDDDRARGESRRRRWRRRRPLRPGPPARKAAASGCSPGWSSAAPP